MTYNPEYQKRWYEENKVAHKEKAKANTILHRQRNKEYVDSLKSNPCTDCGVQYPPSAMQFDHIGDDKEINISAAVNRPYSIKRIDAEVAKCELVCANCHAIRTDNRRNGIVG